MSSERAPASPIADEVFDKYGIVDPNAPISDVELLNKIVWEISRRFGLYALNLPHVENLSGQGVVSRMKDALSKRNDS